MPCKKMMMMDRIWAEGHKYNKTRPLQAGFLADLHIDNYANRCMQQKLHSHPRFACENKPRMRMKCDLVYICQVFCRRKPRKVYSECSRAHDASSVFAAWVVAGWVTPNLVVHRATAVNEIQFRNMQCGTSLCIRDIMMSKWENFHPSVGIPHSLT